MRKLKLDIESLDVQSFDTGRQSEGGTVHAQGYTPECPGYGCTNGMSTCAYPTAAHHQCPPGYTDDEPACWQMQPDTYYCFGGSAPYPC